MATTMKEKAIESMEQMDIYKPYIKGFREKDAVCLYEGFGGFWVYQEPEVEAKMKEIEAEYGGKVYAITHEYTEFGEMYDFLYVSKYPEEWDYSIESQGDRHIVFAYCWNKDAEEFSEFGDIVVKSLGGGIARIGG